MEYLQNIDKDTKKQYKLLLTPPPKDNEAPIISQYFVVAICIFQFDFVLRLLFCVLFPPSYIANIDSCLYAVICYEYIIIHVKDFVAFYLIGPLLLDI